MNGVLEDRDLVDSYRGSIDSALASLSRRLGSRVMPREDMRAIAIEAVIYKARWGPVDPALMTTIIKRRILDEFRRLVGRRKSRVLEIPTEDIDHAVSDGGGASVWLDMESSMSGYHDWRATEILRLKLSGYSMGEAAEALAVSPGRASQIFYDALPRMQDALVEMGIRR